MGIKGYLSNAFIYLLVSDYTKQLKYLWSSKEKSDQKDMVGKEDTIYGSFSALKNQL